MVDSRRQGVFLDAVPMYERSLNFDRKERNSGHRRVGKTRVQADECRMLVVGAMKKRVMMVRTLTTTITGRSRASRSGVKANGWFLTLFVKRQRFSCHDGRHYTKFNDTAVFFLVVPDLHSCVTGVGLCIATHDLCNPKARVAKDVPHLFTTGY